MARIGKIQSYDGSTGILLDLDEEFPFSFGTEVSGGYGVGDLVRFTVEGVGTTASGIDVSILT